MTYLDSNKIEYVLFHLMQHLEIDTELRSRFCFINNGEVSGDEKNKIIFPLSDKNLCKKDIITINNIPVLFPLSDARGFYHFNGNTLIFNHDILKSAFYLLSGYQEHKSTDLDRFNRYKYDASIQKELGIITKPIVNYYFEILIEGIMLFCEKNTISCKRKKSSFSFVLSHDVDNIDYYTVNNVLYKVKEIVGAAPSAFRITVRIKQFFKGVFELLKFSKKNNPTWNFDYLRKVEKRNGFKSTFYFLDKDLKHQDSYYDLQEPRMVKLMNDLHNDGCEIGLHGTCRSSVEYRFMKLICDKINAVIPEKVVGIRQHRLMYKNPQTLLIHQKTGLKYDSSLLFAEHEGFRNSYCHPFRIYNFTEDKMSDVWEIPLNIMDGTLFGYRKLSFAEAKKSVKQILREVKKFDGVFSLLWHNDFFDEERYPKIKMFYEEILSEIKKSGSKSKTGKEIVIEIEKNA